MTPPPALTALTNALTSEGIFHKNITSEGIFHKNIIFVFRMFGTHEACWAFFLGGDVVFVFNNGLYNRTTIQQFIICWSSNGGERMRWPCSGGPVSRLSAEKRTRM